MFDIVQMYGFSMFDFLPKNIRCQLRGSQNIQGFALIYEQPCLYFNQGPDLGFCRGVSTKLTFQALLKYNKSFRVTLYKNFRVSRPKMDVK